MTTNCRLTRRLASSLLSCLLGGLGGCLLGGLGGCLLGGLGGGAEGGLDGGQPGRDKLPDCHLGGLLRGEFSRGRRYYRLALAAGGVTGRGPAGR
ncbi:MAG TPA: hypothetical protein VFU36_11110, partial [Jatrophihabitans sp.]|nr:hypothetical protein [Jatrophihabitans sp.]